ncbi:MAG: hypothetical protein AAF125_10075 [Chloroflexota bacterium]
MRLPAGIGTAWHIIKWGLLVLAFGAFAANIVVPIGAIIYFITVSDVATFLLSGLIWGIGTGGLLWSVARHGRKERRAGRDRRHASGAKDRALPHRTLTEDYEILDIGVKPWRTGSRVFRDETLPDDIPSFYPTIKLWMKRAYFGKLIVEFYDDRGQRVPELTRSRRGFLMTGFRNITLQDEVSLEGLDLPEGVWSMHVRLDDELLAIHEIEWFEVGVEQEPEEDFVYPHAQAAVRLAGASVNAARSTLTDVGLIVARAGGNDVNIYRTESIPLDAVAVQPFVRFNLPGRAAGDVRFVLQDAAGTAHFENRTQHAYQPGDNLITAGARLPVDGSLPLGTGWQLDVHVGQMLVARHAFDWRQGAPPIKDPLAEDGEISQRLRQRLQDQNEELSLRDLLAEQRRRQGRG